jgi:hypothetical protein
MDDFTNTASVEGTDPIPGGDVGDTDTADAVILKPELTLKKFQSRNNSNNFTSNEISVHVGDTVQYRMEATTSGDAPLTIDFQDQFCGNTLQGPTGDDGDGKLEKGETWVWTCSHVVTAADGDQFSNTAKVTGTDQIGGPNGTITKEATVTANVLDPKTLVVKEGNVTAYPGDKVTYTFAVTNNGNTPLHDVKVTDDKCSPVSSAPTQRRNDDGDDLLERIGTDGVSPEVWIFSCETTIPADHKIGDTNPIVNTATATGKDPLDKEVTATDDHKTTVLHPAIQIEKTGPGTADAGAILDYTLTVTNPGDVPFERQKVIVTDPKCDAPPLLSNQNGDASPEILNPGDTWTYTCSYQTDRSETSVLNVARVDGEDPNGRKVSDEDDLPTTLNAIEIEPETIISGRARLRGPSGCVAKPFRAVVTGRQMRRVVFYLNGKKVKTINVRKGRTPQSTQRVSYRLRPSSLSRGVQRVTARIRYRAEARTPRRTLRFAFQRCSRVLPKFTG